MRRARPSNLERLDTLSAPVPSPGQRYPSPWSPLGARRAQSSEPQRGRPLVGWDVPFPSSTEKEEDGNRNRLQSPVRSASNNGRLNNRMDKQEKEARRSDVQEILRLYQMLQAMRMCHDRQMQRIVNERDRLKLEQGRLKAEQHSLVEVLNLSESRVAALERELHDARAVIDLLSVEHEVATGRGPACVGTKAPKTNAQKPQQVPCDRDGGWGSGETREEVVEQTRADMRKQFAKLRLMWEDELRAECLRAAETGAEKARAEMREIIGALHVEKAALSPVREGGGRAAPSPGRSPLSTGRASPKSASRSPGRSPTASGRGSPKGLVSKTWTGSSQSPKLWEYLGPEGGRMEGGSEGRGKASATSSPRGSARLSHGRTAGQFVAPSLGECRAKALRRLAAILRLRCQQRGFSRWARRHTCGTVQQLADMAIEHSRQLLAAGRLQHTLEAGTRRRLGRALHHWRLTTHDGTPPSSSQRGTTQPLQTSIDLSRYRPLIRRVVASYLEQRLGELLPPMPPPSDGRPSEVPQSMKERTLQLAATRLVGAYRKSQRLMEMKAFLLWRLGTQREQEFDVLRHEVISVYDRLKAAKYDVWSYKRQLLDWADNHRDEHSWGTEEDESEQSHSHPLE